MLLPRGSSSTCKRAYHPGRSPWILPLSYRPSSKALPGTRDRADLSRSHRTRPLSHPMVVQLSGAPGHRGRLCHSKVGRLLFTHMLPPLDADDIAKDTIEPHCYRQKQTREANGSTPGSLASK
jgi:hypothetical protein